MQKRFDKQAKNISEKLGLAYDWQEAQTYTKYWSEKNWRDETRESKIKDCQIQAFWQRF